MTIWVGAICTFAIFSILYKENPMYRFFEHVFIGLAAGQGLYITWTELLKPRWWDVMVGKGQWWWALAIIPGLMFYFIYSQRHSWVSRVVMGAFIGLGAGAMFQDFANNYVPQIRGSFKPIIPGGAVGWSAAVNNLIFVTVLVTVMAYFFFSIDHTAPAMRKTASLGRWLLMFAFGAMFGATVMARMSLFIGRIDFLLNDWGPIVPLWFWAAAGTVIAGIIVYLLARPKNPKRPAGLPNGDTLPSETIPEGEGA